MRRMIAYIVVALIMSAAFVAPVWADTCAGEANTEVICCGGVDVYNEECPPELVPPDDPETELIAVVRSVAQALTMIVGAIAGVVIVIAGIMYSIAIGDPGKTAAARKMILYAVIGLIVSLSAYAITSFILGALEG